MNPDEHYALKLFLPDENCIMCDVSHLAEKTSDVSNTKWVTELLVYDEFMKSDECHFVHKSIPRQGAINLGVRPLISHSKCYLQFTLNRRC